MTEMNQTTDADPGELLALLHRLGVSEMAQRPEATAVAAWKSKADSVVAEIAPLLGRALELVRPAVGRQASACAEVVGTAGVSCGTWARGEVKYAYVPWAAASAAVQVAIPERAAFLFGSVVVAVG